MTVNSDAPKRRYRLGIDLDGVCYDFAASLRQFLVTQGHPEHRFPEPEEWHFHSSWGLTLEEWLDACHQGVDAGIVFRHGQAFPGVRDALHGLRDAGHELHVVTDRSFGQPGRSEQHTREWLAAENLPYDTVTFSRDKTIVPTDLFIDDRLENYDALDEAGVQVYLLSRPWNMQKDNRRRVESLPHFADVVHTLATK